MKQEVIFFRGIYEVIEYRFVLNPIEDSMSSYQKVSCSIDRQILRNNKSCKRHYVKINKRYYVKINKRILVTISPVSHPDSRSSKRNRLSDPDSLKLWTVVWNRLRCQKFLTVSLWVSSDLYKETYSRVTHRLRFRFYSFVFPSSGGTLSLEERTG